MDLSWCIICDKRIEDDESLDEEHNSLLYCSDECRLKDEQKQQLKEPVLLATSKITTSSNTTPYHLSLRPPFLLPAADDDETKITQINSSKLNNTKILLAKHKSPSTAANNTSSYPWIPLYRKKHQINYLLNSSVVNSKKCSTISRNKNDSQPAVAGSPIAANASFITSSTFLISTR